MRCTPLCLSSFFSLMIIILRKSIYDESIHIYLYDQCVSTSIIKTKSSLICPSISAACADTIVHKNQFFLLFQKNIFFCIQCQIQTTYVRLTYPNRRRNYHFPEAWLFPLQQMINSVLN